MTQVAELFKIDPANFTRSVAEAQTKLTDGEVVLDFSAVERVDATGLRALEDLTAKADQRAVKVALLGVNVGVYKVLKLARLTPRFTLVG